MKMKDRNAQLKSTLGSMPENKVLAEAAARIPDPDAKNLQGYDAYSVEDTYLLISMLNTQKVEPHFYRTENELIKQLSDLIEKVVAHEGAYFVAQAIVWSRCVGEGMRTINHLAAALLAPYLQGETWAKHFYSAFNKKTKVGGCIYRPDDMMEIKSAFEALNSSVLTNPMKKGFAKAIESLDAYSIFKYKNQLIDICNLVHPSPKKSKATIEINGEPFAALTALMTGMNVSADTWEVAQSDAGQEVAKAVREGKLNESEAKEVLSQAKADNWRSLLLDGKLGILAAIRNLRNIIEVCDHETIREVAAIISNPTLIKNGKIMPYQMEYAYEIVKFTFDSPAFKSESVNMILDALEMGLNSSIENLKEALPGKNLVILDCSGSMNWSHIMKGDQKLSGSCLNKAAIIAAMICKATGADLIRFGSRAEYHNYSPNPSTFELAVQLKCHDMGGTNLALAWNLAKQSGKKYDRVFILSDNECNEGNNKIAYKAYVKSIGDPYIYSVDMAAYGTMPIRSDKVHYYFGYGYAFFDAVATDEFNPSACIDKIRAVRFV